MTFACRWQIGLEVREAASQNGFELDVLQNRPFMVRQGKGALVIESACSPAKGGERNWTGAETLGRRICVLRTGRGWHTAVRILLLRTEYTSRRTTLLDNFNHRTLKRASLGRDIILKGSIP